jgi:dTDP-4-amino-4,6-dideoxygalactose transaminase
LQTTRTTSGVAPRPFEQPVYVTRPLLPDLQNYTATLQGIWQRQWLTNNGQLHDKLERALCDHLQIHHLSLVSSATAGLMLAFRALELSGEAITTPLTSPATVNALTWCGLTPVFADIDPLELTLDPAAVERALTPRTRAIVGVHIYGIPCRNNRLQAIAKRHKLRVVYDAAHAFGTEVDGEPVVKWGDASVLSFHATKLFNTAEGGAVVTQDPDLKRRIDLFRNIGIQDEVTVAVPGINARMNEFAAALGLANLNLVESERLARDEIARAYSGRLNATTGMNCVAMPAGVRNSQHYFMVRVTDASPVSRDDLCERLKRFNVFARRYFYPLCSDFSFYRDALSADPRNLPVARRVAQEIVCLPLYGALGAADAHRICDMIEYILQAK